MKRALLSFVFALAITFAFAQRDYDCGNCIPNGSAKSQFQLASLDAADLLTIYPNPATNFFMLKNGDHISRVQVYNLVGRQVYNQSHAGKNAEHRVAELPRGMYLVKLLDRKGKVAATQRLNKN